MISQLITKEFIKRFKSHAAFNPSQAFLFSKEITEAENESLTQKVSMTKS